MEGRREFADPLPVDEHPDVLGVELATDHVDEDRGRDDLTVVRVQLEAYRLHGDRGGRLFFVAGQDPHLLEFGDVLVRGRVREIEVCLDVLYWYRSVSEDVGIQAGQLRRVQQLGVGEEVVDGLLGIGVLESIVCRHHNFCSMNNLLTVVAGWW